jgi:hypothetical protein
MEEDEGNGVLVEDASASQQEGRGVPQGPEPLFNPPAPEEVQEAEDFVPPPQPGDPPEEVEVPQMVVDELSSHASRTPRGDSLMQEVYQAGLEQEEIDQAVQEQESLQLASYDTDLNLRPPRRQTRREAGRHPPFHLADAPNDGSQGRHAPNDESLGWRPPLYLADTPKVRTRNAFIREGLRQSVGGVVPPSKLYEESEEEREEKRNEDMMLLTTTHTGPVIDGCAVKVTRVPRPLSEVTPVRLWKKQERAALDPDQRQAFVKEAVRTVLRGNNRLTSPQVKVKSSQTLANVQNVQSQIKTLIAHMIRNDIYDVMTVVVPVDVKNRCTLEQRTFNVMTDYHVLHAIHVANSNSWYHLWVQDSYIQENLALTLTLFQNNTDESLWTRCWERYEEYHPAQQGGPLMAYLILSSLLESSEQALEHLLTVLRELDISKIPGEDIEQVALLMKSTYRVLKASSTKTRSYVPADFVKMIFNILLTCTVPEFTHPLQAKRDEIQLQADMTGSRPDWPSVSQLLLLAVNMYQRLKASGIWAGGKTGAAFPAETAPPQANRPRKPRCWNCGDEHLLKDCPKPHDQAKIDAARKRFLNWRRSRGQRTGKPNANQANGKPPKYTTSSDGKPMILNRNGAYVLDQKKYKALRETLASSSSPPSATSVPSSTSSDPAAPDASPQAHVAITEPDEVSARADAIRSALRNGMRSTS